METIIREGSPKTPYILMDGDNGVIEIKGRSIPENSVEFYKPLIDWLESYSALGGKSTTTNVQLEYFNTSSSKCLLDIFKKLEFLYRKGTTVVINWYYEEDDEDMYEAGEDYATILNVPINLIELED